MKALVKLSLLLLISLVSITVLVIAEGLSSWGHSFLLVATFLLTGATWLLAGFACLKRRYGLIIPFALSLVVMYALMALILPQALGIAAGTPALACVLRGAYIGAVKAILFASTMLSISLILDRVRKEDIIGLPFGPHIKKVLLLSFVLYGRASIMIEEIKRCFEHLEQGSSLAPRGFFARLKWKMLGFKQAFGVYLRILLGLTVYLLEEAELRGIFMDNHIDHCYS